MKVGIEPRFLDHTLMKVKPLSANPILANHTLILRLAEAVFRGFRTLFSQPVRLVPGHRTREITGGSSVTGAVRDRGRGAALSDVRRTYPPRCEGPAARSRALLG